jgi:hypothetical protein
MKMMRCVTVAFMLSVIVVSCQSKEEPAPAPPAKEAEPQEKIKVKLGKDTLGIEYEKEF